MVFLPYLGSRQEGRDVVHFILFCISRAWDNAWYRVDRTIHLFSKWSGDAGVPTSHHKSAE